MARESTTSTATSVSSTSDSAAVADAVTLLATGAPAGASKASICLRNSARYAPTARRRWFSAALNNSAAIVRSVADRAWDGRRKPSSVASRVFSISSGARISSSSTNDCKAGGKGMGFTQWPATFGPPGAIVSSEPGRKKARIVRSGPLYSV